MSVWLVTGAQGFLGRYAVAEIFSAEPDARVIGVGRSPLLRGAFSHCVTAPAGEVPATLPDEIAAIDRPTYQYVSLDLTQGSGLNVLLQETRPDFILHFASALRGDRLSKQLTSNVEATASLFRSLEHVRNLTPTVVLGSTGGVYGALRSEDLPVNESHCPRPADEYAVTKLAAEHLAMNAALRAGIRLVIGRLFNLLGPGQDERHVAARIALQLAQAERGGHLTLTLGSLEATRDFIDVRDAARACVELAQNPVAHGIVNIASGRECSIGDLVQIFLKHPKAEVTVKSVSGGVLDVPRHVGDVRRLSGYGFRPRFTLESSAGSIWAYYQRLWGI